MIFTNMRSKQISLFVICVTITILSLPKYDSVISLQWSDELQSAIYEYGHVYVIMRILNLQTICNLYTNILKARIGNNYLPYL